MSSAVTVQLGLGLLVVAMSGCLGAPADSGSTTADESIGTNKAALLNSDEFLYFRCNATGWDVDESNLFKSTSDPYVFNLVYDVTQPGMTGGGDQCVFTKTNQRDGWGTAQEDYDSRDTPITAPGGSFLTSHGGQITIQYPHLGRYKATVNWLQGTFGIEEVQGPAAWEPLPSGHVTTIASAPSAPDTMMAGYDSGKIFLTFNGSSATPSWTRVDTFTAAGRTTNLPMNQVNSIALSPKDSQTAYAIFAGSKMGDKLWKTSTGGREWTPLSQPFGELWTVSVNPIDTQRVYVTSPSGAATSADGGLSWTRSSEGDPLQVPLAAGSSISAVTTVNWGTARMGWVGATNGDVFLSFDVDAATPSWSGAHRGLPQRAVTRLTVDTRLDPPFVYATFAGMSNDSVWMSGNGGEGWVNIHNPSLPTTEVPLPSIYGLLGVSLSPVDVQSIYIDGTGGEGTSQNNGQAWQWYSH